MIPWKQRLYAFLLRRILGPILDASSTQQLHESIEVSFQEGKFVLKDVALNSNYITQRIVKLASSAEQQLGAASSSSISVRHARVGKLEITLSLQEHSVAELPQQHSSDGGGTTAASSSLAWRAMQLGKTSSETESRVSLVANIEISSVEIEIESNLADPCSNMSSTVGTVLNPTVTNTGATDGVAPPSDDEMKESSRTTYTSFISSYVESALASMHLSLQINDLRIQFSAVTAPPSPQKEHSLEIRLASAYYRDVPFSDRIESDGKTNKTVLNKALDFAGIAVYAAEGTHAENVETATVVTNNTTRLLVLQTEGTGQICLRATEYFPEKTNTATTSNAKIQQDIEIKLSQRIHIWLDERSLSYILTVSSSLRPQQRQLDKTALPPVACNSALTTSAKYQNNSLERIDENAAIEQTGEADYSTISGIMKQYQEAWLLAERHEVRGGILIPSHAYEDTDVCGDDDDNGGVVTFDAFFDANDQSFHSYASKLRESLLHVDSNNDGGDDFVHTKVRFFLNEIGVKFVFPEQNVESTTAQHISLEEYILANLGDIHLSGSFSRQSSSLSLTISHLKVDDSQLSCSSHTFPMRTDIGSILHFKQDCYEDNFNEDVNIVAQAPCFSLHFSTTKSLPSISDVEIDVSFEPMELVYHGRTFSNLSSTLVRLKECCSTAVAKSVDDEGTKPTIDNMPNVKLFVSCPSIAVIVPLLETVQVGRLFQRCGQELRATPLSRAHFGLLFEQVLIQKSSSDAGIDYSDIQTASACPITSFACHNLVLFVSAPALSVQSVGTCMQRLDIMALTGRLEVDPVIPVSIEMRSQGSDERSLQSYAREAFPTAPSISSFKARQADEDEDDHIAAVLLSNLKDLQIDSRKSLKGRDPQIDMLSQSERCSAVIRVHVPEVWCDLNATELATCLRMLEAAQPPRQQIHVKTTATPVPEPHGQGQFPITGISLNLEKLTFSIHGSSEGDQTGFEPFSFCFASDGFKAHAVIEGTFLRQSRLLLHDFCLYDVTGASTLEPKMNLYLATLRDRVAEFRKRFLRRSRCMAKPLFYRSKLFAPLSPTSPSFILDLQSRPTSCCSEKSVNVTLYHTTVRCDVDSTWLARIQHIVEKIGGIGSDHKDSPDSNTLPSEESSLTKCFVSIADCSVDYNSSSTFKTASRTIVLVSDVRITSNLIKPAGSMQAFNLSLGDASVNICNSRINDTHEFNNLPRASALFRTGGINAVHSRRRGHTGAPESVLRGLNFIQVLNLDSMEAVVVVANTIHPVAKPTITLSISFGTFGLYVCQDSFACLMGTIGELQAKLTALTDEQVAELRMKTPQVKTKSSNGALLDLQSKEQKTSTASEQEVISDTVQGDRFAKPQLNTLDVIKKKSALGTTHVVQRIEQNSVPDFMLDGYDWTTIDYETIAPTEIPDGEEQYARWYGPTSEQNQSSESNISFETCQVDEERAATKDKAGLQSFRLNFHHFALQTVSNPLGDGDMGASNFAGTSEPPSVGTRILIHELGVRMRFFDGYDWPLSLNANRRKKRADSVFIIAEAIKKRNASNSGNAYDGNVTESPRLDKKAKILEDLLVAEANGEYPLYAEPIPREKAARLEQQAEATRLSRRTSKFLQISASGVSARVDSFSESQLHSLASCMDLSVHDFFVAETISDTTIRKMAGEWVNEDEHPRDTSEGLLKMKMVTWHAASRVTAANEIASDECQVRVEMLPLRCKIDQRAVRFAQAFFSASDEQQDGSNPFVPEWTQGLHMIPPPKVQLLSVKRCKLKVDYNPEKLDVTALREGSYVELINLSPLDGMVLTLKKVELFDHSGFDSAIGDLLRRWIQDICATQLHKFIINARPFEPVTTVGGGVLDLVVLPWEAYRSGGSITQGIRSGLSSLGGAVAHETLTTTSRVTQFAANGLANAISRQDGPATRGGGAIGGAAASISLPSRPVEMPRSLSDVSGHAIESVARGVQVANYKIVIVPYREFRKSGPSGAAKSVLKGIPVAIMAPISGATEALSYALLGARNQIRPDIRKEEEASHRGLHYEL